jgi:hypothetical protein
MFGTYLQTHLRALGKKKITQSSYYQSVIGPNQAVMMGTV